MYPLLSPSGLGSHVSTSETVEAVPEMVGAPCNCIVDHKTSGHQVRQSPLRRESPLAGSGGLECPTLHLNCFATGREPRYSPGHDYIGRCYKLNWGTSVIK